ncbi:glutamine-hydrolyzing GMP synthase, partial [Thermogladius sp.]|uniref:glutamine-hydrolyzing GMP synthase n=1 Tax=Thermogladius sp. TaxID=2023064 RepID=UPI003D0B417A
RVLVVDYGGQYAHLVARRLRGLGVFSLVEPYHAVGSLDLDGYSAVVLSGGYDSPPPVEGGVLEAARRVLYESRVPLLAISYGHQLLALLLGGSVADACGGQGTARVRVLVRDPVFDGWGETEEVWVGRGGCVLEPPPGSTVLAVSEDGAVAAFRAEVNGRPVYGVRFHPEAHHTRRGLVLLDNFLRLAGAVRGWGVEAYYHLALQELERYAGAPGRVVAAVSGGVDSATAALLARRVFGDRLVPVLVDHGLFREGEVEEVREELERAGLEPVYVDARERFLSKLEGLADCEERRRVIGEEFARVFDELMTEYGAGAFVQGTIYPDVVESGRPGGGRVKTHHNVAGLPRWFREKYAVLEPLRYLYKEEVRELARALGLPDYFLKRHPFPGPGLAARVVGPFNRRKLEVCRRATAIVEKVLRRRGLYDRVWQAFAVVGDDTWVGVKGGSRRHGLVVIVRVVESADAMTADYSRLPYEVLDEMSREITSSIDDVTMVAYAVTGKPPSTIEPC